ncbi:MAG: hypothetical protein QG597_958 [Actinomycetota bacterium]|nr:hypothetical protein [Actinomycetota bacterium]
MRPTDLPRLRDDHASAIQAGTYSGSDPRTEARLIRAAGLWWVSPAMTSLASGAADTIPEWTPAEAVPSPTGLLWWDGDLPLVPLQQAPVSTWRPDNTGRMTAPTGPVRAVLWVRDGDAVEVQVHTHSGHLTDPAGQLLTWPGPPGLVPVATARLEVVDGQPRIIVPRDAGAVDWISDLVALLGATWILMREPLVAQTRALREPPRQGRAVGRKAKRPAVITVDARPAAPREQHADTTVEPSPERRPPARHLVTGHWRRVATGPGGTRRILRWIPPHMRGDGDPAPPADRVRVWRR